MRLITTMEMRDFEEFLNSQEEVDDFIDSIMADAETLAYFKKLRDEEEEFEDLIEGYYKGAA